MPLPGDVVTITVNAKYADFLGNPASGTVTFTPQGSAAFADTTDGLILESLGLVADIDNTGSISITLPATDNTVISPEPWTYQVTETIAGMAPRVYSIALPHTLGAAVNLAALSPVTAASPSAPLPVAQGGTGAATAAAALVNLGAAPAVWLNVNAYGAKGDARDLTAVAITAGQNVLTCAGGSFTSADVGKVAYVYGAGSAGAQLVTTISAVTNSTTVTLAANAATTVTSGNAFVGTDDTAAWNAALAAVPANGGVVFLPAGLKSYINSALSVPVSGTIIAGGGWGAQIRYSGSAVSPCIKAASASSRVFVRDIRISQVNATPAGTAIDASNFASSAIERVLIDGGGGSGVPPLIGIDMNGASCHYNVARDCRVNFSGTGSWGIAVRGTSHSNTIDNCRFIPGSAADSTSSGVYITNAHSTTLIHPDVEHSPGNGIFLDATAHATTIVNPYLEANNINIQITSGVQCPVIIGGTIESGVTANIQDNGSVNPLFLNAWPNSGTTVLANVGPLDTTATDIQPAGTQAAGATGKSADAGHVHPAGFGAVTAAPNIRLPEDIGLISWSHDPVGCVNSTLAVAGTLYMARVPVRFARTITNLAIYLAGGATTPAANENYLLLINAAGAIVGQTAAGAIDSATGSSGWLSHAMASAYAAPAGYYWVAAIFNAATPPSMARATGNSLTGPNGGLAGASLSWCVNGTGLTSPPASITPASNTSAGAVTICVGVS